MQGSNVISHPALSFRPSLPVLPSLRSEPKRLFDLMAIQAKEHPLADTIAAKIDGRWRCYSTLEVLTLAADISFGLMQLGIKKGERVAMIAPNRPEWLLVDLAILQLGAVVVPVYPTATETDYQYILSHSDTRVVFVANEACYIKVKAVRAALPKLEQIYTFDHVSEACHWGELAELGHAHGDPEGLELAKAAVSEGDLATLIYTSGTTGTPKGVMLSHRNILASIKAIAQVIPSDLLTRALSFLPLSHILERNSVYYYQSQHIAVYFAESLETILPNLLEVRPEVMVSVPRLLEKFYEAFLATGRTLPPAKAKLFNWAISFAQAYDPEKAVSAASQKLLQMARMLVFRHWRNSFGGNLEVVTVGGSAMPLHIGRVFWAAGMNVLEGYGMTENSPVITSNGPRTHRIGTVGVPVPSVEVTILQEPELRPGEGEILVKGPTVMMGYFRDPQSTAETIDADGWLHTGDIGYFDQGFLRITDRKKEMFKTSGGKYIAPLALESKFKESPIIAQMIVVGENRKFPAALIVPELKTLTEWCKLRGVSFESAEEATQHEGVRAIYAAEIERLNQYFGHWEQIKQFRLVQREWSVQSGQLTPKMSLKRRMIMANHQKLIDSMYGDPTS